MHALAATVPDIEVPRSDVVAARIARKVGPLFGVTWERNPFQCTWVCDFGAITLAEIARGAPYPGRNVQAATDDAPPQPGAGEAKTVAWRLVGRGIWTPRRRPTPAAIANATLNRYGPDTKSAVVLTGANRLLQEVTAAVASVCRKLASRESAPEIRLAVWAGLVLEAFRGQPALVAAAIQARTIQRALTTPWGEHLLLPELVESARCEFGALGADAATPRPTAGALEPTKFDLIDSTLALLDLPLPVADGPLLSRADLLDDIATRSCRRLLQIGHPGRGITWISEAPPGHRRVQSYLRVGSAIAPFVAEALALLGIAPLGDTPDRHLDLAEISGLLAGDDLATRPLLAKRARLTSAHVLANYLRFNDDLLRKQPAVRMATRALTGEAADLAARHLGPNDPVTYLLAGYTAYCAAWDTGRAPDPDADPASAYLELARRLDQVAKAWQVGDLDPGTASYLLEVGAMALGRIPREEETEHAELSRYWREAMLARGVDPDADLAEPLKLPQSQRYHLQNYAAFLAAQATDAAGLRRALAAQQACAVVRELVAEGERADYRSKFTSVRTTHQAAAAIIAKLLTMSRSQSRPADEEGGLAGDEAASTLDSEREALVADGVRHARAALVNPATRAMLEGDDPEVIRLALAVLPVIAEARPPMLDAELLTDADRLLCAAVDQASRLGPALPEQDHAVLADLVPRLATFIRVD